MKQPDLFQTEEDLFLEEAESFIEELEKLIILIHCKLVKCNLPFEVSFSMFHT